MMLQKLRLASAGALMLLAGFVGLMAAHGGTAGEPHRQPGESFAAVSPAPVPKPAPREGVILITSFSTEKPGELFKADGTPIRNPNFGKIINPFGGVISPDGKRVAVLEFKFPSSEERPRRWSRTSMYVLDLESDDGPSAPILDDLYGQRLIWAPDGTKLYGTEIDPKKVDDEIAPGTDYPIVNWVYDLKTKTRTTLALPSGHRVEDVSPDGKTLLTTKSKFGVIGGKTYLTPLATLRPVEVSDRGYFGARFSPDGKQFIGFRTEPRDNGEPDAPILVVFNLADRSETRVLLPKEASRVEAACWSPDGKRIVYRWTEAVDPPKDVPVAAGFGPGRPNAVYASRVNIADPDGSRAKTIIRREWNEHITGIDWR